MSKIVWTFGKKKPFTEILGATGQFPQGKLSPDDKGELRLMIGAWRGTVRIDFGKEIAWLSLSPEQTRAIARMLMEYADKVEND